MFLIRHRTVVTSNGPGQDIHGVETVVGMKTFRKALSAGMTIGMVLARSLPSCSWYGNHGMEACKPLICGLSGSMQPGYVLVLIQSLTLHGTNYGILPRSCYLPSASRPLVERRDVPRP